ncbi:hypothetical protein [Streptomyces sp. IBSBF 2507]|uniref:hypothetical protein n=1 Tax=Streptomyces sp. IBSBF 2507 TaxID=2903530 RepID=UPI00351DEF1C
MTDLAAYLLLVAALTAWMCGHQSAASWPRQKAHAPVSRPRTRPRDSRATRTPPSPARARTAVWAYTQPIHEEQT